MKNIETNTSAKNLFLAYRMVFEYFELFQFAPNIEEIHRFLTIKQTRDEVKSYLTRLLNDGVIKSEVVDGNPIYFLQKSSHLSRVRENRLRYSEDKITKAFDVIRKLSIFPSIVFVGLTGSVSMRNARQNDDIDYFIITKKKTLFTTRMLIMGMLYLLGVRRARGNKKSNNKICVNMLFDGSDILIPKKKQSYFTAHELLHMLPLLNREGEYQKLLNQNNWTNGFFPNIKNTGIQYKHISYNSSKISIFNIFLYGEKFFHFIQKKIIEKHTTGEYITDKQLWFFPRDISKKLPKRFTI